MKQKIFVIGWIVALAIIFIEPAWAQCPMCKASVEASLKEGSTAAVGLNRGILYLLSMPYLLFSVLFFLWYFNGYKKRR